MTKKLFVCKLKLDFLEDNFVLLHLFLKKNRNYFQYYCGHENTQSEQKKNLNKQIQIWNNFLTFCVCWFIWIMEPDELKILWTEMISPSISILVIRLVSFLFLCCQWIKLDVRIFDIDVFAGLLILMSLLFESNYHLAASAK